MRAGSHKSKMPATDKSGRMTMHFDRSDFLKAGGALTFAPELPTLARADVNFDPTPGTWRNFEIVTRLEIVKPVGTIQAWIPLPSVNKKDWIKSKDSQRTT